MEAHSLESSNTRVTCARYWDQCFCTSSRYPFYWIRRSFEMSIHPKRVNTEEVFPAGLLCTGNPLRDLTMRLSKQILLQGQAYGKAQTRIKISCGQGLDPSLSPAISPSRKDSSDNHCIPSSNCPSNFSRLSSLFYTVNGESYDLETRLVTFQVRAYLLSGILPVIP